MGELRDLQQTNGVSAVHPQLFPFQEKNIQQNKQLTIKNGMPSKEEIYLYNLCQ